jgi:putative membrane protein insertion efficiency factor
MIRDVVCLLRVYKRFLSPDLRTRLCCRFYPTCSEYAALVVRKHGVVRGTRMTVNRLRRCRPDNLQSCIDLP